MNKGNPFKDIRFILFIAVILTLVILFINSGSGSKDKAENMVKESFRVPAKENVNNSPVKDAGLNDAISELGKEQISKGDTTDIKELAFMEPKEPVKKVKKPTKNIIPKTNEPKVQEQSIPIINNVHISESPVQGQTWRRKQESGKGPVSFKSVVFGDIKLVSSRGIIKVRTTEDFVLDDLSIPRNTIIIAYLNKETDYISIHINELSSAGQKINKSFDGYTNEGRGILYKDESLRKNLREESGDVVNDIPSSANLLENVATRTIAKTVSNKARQDIITIQDGTKITFYMNN